MENKNPVLVACLLLAVSVGISMLRIVVNAFQSFFSFWNFLIVLGDAAICITVFLKRRDILLLGAVTLRAGFELLLFASAPSFVSFLYVVAWAVLFVLTLCVCEQDIIKLDLSQIADICKQLFFVPAAIIVVCGVIKFFFQISYIGVFRALVNAGITLISGAAVLFFAHWLANPDDAPGFEINFL